MYSVHGGMYFVHNHNSLPIKSDQPCDAGESQLHAGSAYAEQHPSCQQSPQAGLTDHPAQARLATSKLPQPLVNLIHIAATASISSSSVTAAHWEARTLVLAVLVRNGC